MVGLFAREHTHTQLVSFDTQLFLVDCPLWAVISGIGLGDSDGLPWMRWAPSLIPVFMLFIRPPFFFSSSFSSTLTNVPKVGQI